MPPGWRRRANTTAADEIDEAGNAGKPPQDDPDGDEPVGKVEPHHVRRLQVSEVGQQCTYEAGDRERHQHRMDRMHRNPRGGLWKLLAHARSPSIISKQVRTS